MSITLEQLLSDYRDQNGGSYQLWRRAHESLPGGNTRTRKTPDCKVRGRLPRH